VDFIIALRTSVLYYFSKHMGFYALTAVSEQRQHMSTKLHGLTYQKTFIFISKHVSKCFKYLASYPLTEFPVLNMRNSPPSWGVDVPLATVLCKTFLLRMLNDS
jgi:hypothetical protein